MQSTRELFLPTVPKPENPYVSNKVLHHLLLRHNSRICTLLGIGASCMTTMRSCSYQASPSVVSFPSLDPFLFSSLFLPSVKSWLCWKLLSVAEDFLTLALWYHVKDYMRKLNRAQLTWSGRNRVHREWRYTDGERERETEWEQDNQTLLKNNVSVYIIYAQRTFLYKSLKGLTQVRLVLERS